MPGLRCCLGHPANEGDWIPDLNSFLSLSLVSQAGALGVGDLLIGVLGVAAVFARAVALRGYLNHPKPGSLSL